MADKSADRHHEAADQGDEFNMGDQVQESGQELAEQGQESNMADQNDGPAGTFPSVF